MSKRFALIQSADAKIDPTAIEMCLFHLLCHTGQPSQLYSDSESERETLVKNHSITSWTDVVIAKDCNSSKMESSFKYIYRYKYNNPLTDTIADDSNNMLMITISAISLSWRGVRKLPQETFVNHMTNVINDNHSASFFDFCSSVNYPKNSHRF